jgi:hypothetical protein
VIGLTLAAPPGGGRGSPGQRRTPRIKVLLQP